MLSHELHDLYLSSFSFLTKSQKATLTRLGCSTAWDLLSYFPKRYEDRTKLGSIELQCTQKISARVRVIKHSYIPFRKTRFLQITVGDGSTQAYLACFGRNFLARHLPVGQWILLYTQFSKSYGKWISSQFDYALEKNYEDFLTLQPVYHLKKGIRQHYLRQIMKKTIPRITDQLEDDIDPEKLLGSGISGADRFLHGVSYIAAVYHTMHLPEDAQSIELAQKLIALRELVRIQLRFSMTRIAQHYPLEEQVDYKPELFDTLPFRLSSSQIDALHTTLEHIRQNRTGIRIIQGDVGCGKTIVALLIAILLAQKGYQTIFLAPTYLLALQHFQNNQNLLRAHSLHSAFLHRNLTTRELRRIQQSFLEGSTDILFGTHKLLYESIEAKKLALLIIDEQQRFGVAQRRALVHTQFPPPYVLMLSATPIPRSVAHILSNYITVSTITEKPQNRKPIRTHLCTQQNIEQAYQLIEIELKKGHQAYIVYPRISESEHLRSIESMLESIQKRFAGHSCGMVHSQLDAEDIATTMEAFRQRDIHVLLASSIIEVGIDVKNATALLIEHAELFGLSTLHQLRGRIGRREFQSYCCLSYAEDLTDVAKQRLKIMYETSDGFLISEKDLLLRGPGDIVGTNQSGFSALTFMLALKHKDLLEASRAIASQLLTDPTGIERLGIEHSDSEHAESIL